MRLAVWWEKLIAVNSLDEEDTRQGRLFNTLMIIGILVVIFLALTYPLLDPGPAGGASDQRFGSTSG